MSPEPCPCSLNSARSTHVSHLRDPASTANVADREQCRHQLTILERPSRETSAPDLLVCRCSDAPIVDRGPWAVDETVEPFDGAELSNAFSGKASEHRVGQFCSTASSSWPCGEASRRFPRTPWRLAGPPAAHLEAVEQVICCSHSKAESSTLLNLHPPHQILLAWDQQKASTHHPSLTDMNIAYTLIVIHDDT